MSINTLSFCSSVDSDSTQITSALGGFKFASLPLITHGLPFVPYFGVALRASIRPVGLEEMYINVCSSPAQDPHVQLFCGREGNHPTLYAWANARWLTSCVMLGPYHNSSRCRRNVMKKRNILWPLAIVALLGRIFGYSVLPGM